MSISVKNITKVYGEQLALNDVSFEIKAGEIVGFLGPNGAGKSTMMKILTCYIPQTSGEASVCDFDISENSIAVRENIGYLPEHNPLYLDMYVKEYLQFIAGIHHIKDAASRVKNIIEKVGLGAEQNKQIGSLSKGYRQRVGLAQAMIHDPKVLILDEPTTGLDPNQIVEIRNLIREIGKEKTVMMSTHIMQEVEAICDRAIIINKGIIVADDKVSVIKNKTTGKQLIKVEFSDSPSLEKLNQIKEIENIKKINEKTFEITSDSSQDIRPIIFRFAVDNQLEVLTINKEEQSMEQIFKQLTLK
jgi:ABC-2 type transport system ATP-binding protein